MVDNVHKEYIGKNSEPLLQDRWWQTKDIDYNAVFSAVDTIENNQTYQQEQNILHARIYSNMELLGWSRYLYKLNASNRADQKIIYNVIESVIDTAHSKISKNKPKPIFLTNKGNYTQKEKAKNLSEYIGGTFYNTDYYEKAQKVFKSAAVFGTGFLKVFIKDGNIKIEHTPIDEIRVDEIDGSSGEPHELFQVTYISKDVLIDMFPKSIDDINRAETSLPITDTIYDVVKVIEAWKLPPSKKGQGKHAICIATATLFEEPYNKPYFPFPSFRWKDRLSGYFGSGLCEQLKFIQIEINKTLKNITKAQNNVAIPRVFVESGSKVITQHINNEVGAIVKYTGQKPVFDTPIGMTPEVYNHLKWLIQSAYEVSGVSQLSATSQKPAGLDSAVAIREYSDIETERFALVAMAYEKLALDTAEIVIDLSRDLYAENPSLAVQADGGDFIKKIKWKDVNLEAEAYVMKAYPISLLPSTPSGKLQKVIELMQAGFIDKDQSLKLLDFPDLGAFTSLQASGQDLVDKTLAEIIETSKYLSPEPAMPLDYAISAASKQYLLGRVDGLPDKKLNLLLRFLDDVERLQKEMAPPPEAAPPSPMPLPQAVPAPLPQSEMLPMQPELLQPPIPQAGV